MVLGDPTVRMFGIRDLDMYMLPREREAVTVWEMGNYTNKDKQFYIMRDTPQARNRAGIFMPVKEPFVNIFDNSSYLLSFQLISADACRFHKNCREVVGVLTTT